MATLTIADLRESTKAVITIKDAAEVLGVDPRTVWGGIRQGNLPSVRVGRRTLLPRERFLALFAPQAEQ